MAADLGFDYDKCFEKFSELKESDIQELKVWTENLEKDSIVPKDINLKQLVLFHVACEFNVESTKKCIKSYYTVRDKAPMIFDNRNLSDPDLKKSAKALEFFTMPRLTADGHLVIFHRLHDYEPSNYDFDCSSRLFQMTIDSALYEEGPVRGGVFMFDLAGCKFSHIFRVGLGTLSKSMKYIQTAMPIHIETIHIFNCSPVFDKILALIKPFMAKGMINKFRLYPPGDSLEKFYAQYVPKKLLPSDFGGELPADTQVLHQENLSKMERCQEYFLQEERHRKSWLKKAQGKLNVEGPFSGLNID